MYRERERESRGKKRSMQEKNQPMDGGGYTRTNIIEMAPPAAVLKRIYMLIGRVYIGSFGLTVITASRDSSGACDAINKGIICRDVAAKQTDGDEEGETSWLNNIAAPIYPLKERNKKPFLFLNMYKRGP